MDTTTANNVTFRTNRRAFSNAIGAGTNSKPNTATFWTAAQTAASAIGSQAAAASPAGGAAAALTDVVTVDGRRVPNGSLATVNAAYLALAGLPSAKVGILQGAIDAREVELRALEQQPYGEADGSRGWNEARRIAFELADLCGQMATQYTAMGRP